MSVGLLGKGASPGVNSANLLVLRRGSEEASVTLPGGRVHHIREGDREPGLARIEVPDLELQTTGGGENLRGSSVEGKALNFLGMALENEQRVGEVALEPFLWNAPKTDL